ncbi:Gfo/Idh/MocA family oxidoreductase [Jeotgalibacillus sp. S-D1]|uniref:Gfo/Idh/MocA family protein n=1 Tax=Jeotgalibacillus sp. S-D1 TaxID=2552189 RepID=UPI001059C0D1|nr:Gfo/Idh/MocA family oxidoreductase [Jeotgalibacillus sp. S-D1]TDL32766.1 Gfo/Idh/MocA family oxidoreductase [Jeotgalibacillus sp. S-D1]
MESIQFNYEYTNKLKVGFIGCGAHSFRNVYPTFDYAPIELVAVCDLSEERAEIYRKRFGANHTYTDYKEMLIKENLDAVFVVLNFDKNGHPLYPKILPDIMETGIPVWVEKPIAYTAKEAETLLELQSKTGVQVLVSNKRYFYPSFAGAKKIIEKKEFGEAVSVTGRYPLTLSPFNEEIGERTGLHWFLDICHPMSGLHYLMGDVKEMCFIENQPSGNVQTLLQFESGAIGSLHLPSTQAETSPFETYEVIGNKENVVIENAIRLAYYKGKKGSGEYGKAPSYIGDNPEDGPVIWEPEFSLGQLYNKNLFLQGMVQSVNHFASAVLNDKAVEKATLRDSWHLTKIFDAYKNNKAGKWIQL